MLYSQSFTVMTLAALANNLLWYGSPEALFNIPFAKSEKTAAKTEQPSPTPPSQPGLKPEVLTIISSVHVALQELRAAAASLVKEGVDVGGYSLHRPVAFIMQWADNMDIFCAGARRRTLSLALTQMKRSAGSLESAIPRWDVVFRQKEMNEVLIKQRILENPTRSQVKPWLAYAKSLTKQISLAEGEWKIDVDGETSKALAQAAIDGGCQYMVVAAACNTLVYHSKSERAGKMSDNVIALATKQNFHLPDNLRLRTLS